MLFGIGLLLYELAVALHYMALASQASRQAELLARDAELRALKAQFNPHFLFNSLHSISALTAIDPAQAREMCIRLSDFLRSTLGLGDRTSISLGEELALVGIYLEIEQVRFGTRLRTEKQIEPGCEHIHIPPLLLQPLVENAIKHGVATLVDGGWIKLAANQNGEILSVRVENNFDPEAPSNRRNGVGLPNIRRRLRARYGSEGTLEVSIANNRFRAELSLPTDI
jgi:LytS/YehU family sensor histidine kinase